jgi:hypothetical protein
LVGVSSSRDMNAVLLHGGRVVSVSNGVAGHNCGVSVLIGLYAGLVLVA